MTHILGVLALATLAQDPGPDVGACVRVPVTNVRAGCCRTAVADALAALEPVVRTRWEEDGSAVVLCVRKGQPLRLSAIRRALETATAGMGRQMGVRYELDPAALRVDGALLCIRGQRDDTAGRVRTLLAGLENVEEVDVRPGPEGRVCAAMVAQQGGSVSLAGVRETLMRISAERLTIDEVTFPAGCARCEESEPEACPPLERIFCGAGAGACEPGEGGCPRCRRHDEHP